MARKIGVAWMAKTGLLAKFAFFIGLIAAVALPVGALGHRVRLWDHMMGLTLVFSGTVLAVLALVLGAAAFIFALTRKRPADRVPALVGVVAGVLVLGWMAVQYNKAISVVPTHDISTDVVDPPAFDVLVERRPPGSNSLVFTDEEAAMQVEGYPDVATIVSSGEVEGDLARATDIARALGWEIANEDAGLGIVEAVDTTFWFGFKDDIVIRVRSTDDGSVVDLRSVSRVGLVDLGVNAERIREFRRRWASATD